MPIALWGAGGRCKAIIEKMNPELRIQCIFDSNPDKHGQSVLGIPIVAPEDSCAAEKVKAIIVTTCFFEEVGRSVAQNSALKGVMLIDSTSFFERVMAQERFVLL